MSYITGKGATVSVEVAGTMTEIKQVTGITAPTMEQTTIDVTHLGSAAREFVPALQSNSNFSFSVEWDQNATDGHGTNILDLFEGDDSIAGGLRNAGWRIIYTYYNEGTAANQTMTITFDGFISSIAFDEVAVDTVLSATINVQVDGAIIYASA